MDHESRRYKELARAATVGAGASLGACARVGIQSLASGALWPLFVINVAACLAMGFFRPGLLWGKGVLGGLSSYSAVVALAFQLPFATAAGYFALTVIGTLIAWAIGDAAGGYLRRDTAGAHA